MLINCFGNRTSNQEHRNNAKDHTTDHVTVNNDFEIICLFYPMRNEKTW